MKTICSLLLFIFVLITGCLANTEKLILEARLSNVENECNPAPCNTISMTPPYTKIQHSLIPQSQSHEGSSKQYHLNDLIGGSKYEIRVSYPAITPADFKLRIVHACKNSELNTLSYILDVAAVYTGVSQIKGKESEPIVYDLVLENLYLGFLFYQVYKIVIAIIGVIALGFFVFIPVVKQLITIEVADNRKDK